MNKKDFKKTPLNNGRITRSKSDYVAGHSPLVDVNSLRLNWEKDLNNLKKSMEKEIDQKLGDLQLSDTLTVSSNSLKNDLLKFVEEKVNIMNDKWLKEIDKVNIRVDQLEEKFTKIESDMDGFEQYGRRQCLVLYGIPETENENTLLAAIDFCNNHLKTNFLQTDLVSAHRFAGGKNLSKNTTTVTAEVQQTPQENENVNKQIVVRARPIIVKFLRIWQKKMVIERKKLLKVAG